MALTLRARLTVAFLAVVLGPVLLSAIFVGTTVNRVDAARAAERLDLAANAVRSSVDALCEQLRTAAQGAALLSVAGRDADGASRVVADGSASLVRVEDLAGTVLLVTGSAPAQPWAQCSDPGARPGQYNAVAARVQMRDRSGALVGYVSAARSLDAALLARLAAAGGASVTLVDGVSDRLSTERADTASRVATVAASLSGTATGRTGDGRYVRRLVPAAGQPLPLAISTAGTGAAGLDLILSGLVALVAVAAVLIAWWLAGTTTRPLAELSDTVDRVAAGDLSARAPVRRLDEVGHLAATFNRMTREMQSYVEALTASRDQLRGHLGVLGQTLSSTHDLHRILSVILQTARVVSGARAGAVLLVEQDALVGISGDRPLRVPLGAGLLGSVAAGGEPVRGRIGRDGLLLAPEEPACHTYVAVPLRGPDSVRGVLALYDRLGEDEFDDADVATLGTFAGQAAIAVENVRMHEEAQRLSHTDPLTGLYNYRTLGESLRREVERANRFGHRLCVLVLDLDRFKEVNDSHGHAAGDAVLVEFARRVRTEIREVDLAFRQGGEEFVLLLPETDALGGSIVADRLCSAVRSDPVPVPARLPSARGSKLARRVPVTVSIGVAVFPEHGTSGAAVMQAADDALYAAKAAGRNTHRVADQPAGLVAGTGGSGASTGPHPPRQSRGR